ncbi:MAG: hypothetical protein M1834_001719 [Cirrosporium novae-zelandiae]|nr:MAG: hypothetical protein M1834_001719 [Cirrosporium novae-zelandiae]
MSMDHLIGKRLNLISKSDIRYVGILHEINPEASTIALENVQSYGTEGRRNNAADEIPPSTSIYEYIVFRGSDVKDITIEDQQKENEPPEPPQVPNDPAILGSGPRPSPQVNPGMPPQPPNRQFQPPPFPQQPPYSYYYPPPGQRFGPPGGPPGVFPPAPGFPGMPYGAPPGWYPPGQGFPPGPQPFNQPPPPIAPPSHTQPPQMPPVSQPSPIRPLSNKSQTPVSQPSATMETVKPASKPDTTTAPQSAPSKQPQPVPPTPPIESKPDVASVLAGPSTSTSQAVPTAIVASKPIPTGPKNTRIAPAVPLPGPVKLAQKTNGVAEAKSVDTVAIPTTSTSIPSKVAADAVDDATRAATAAVAAAMAKLPPAPGQKKPQQGETLIDNLTKKVNDLRTSDAPRGQGRQNGGRYPTGHRGRGNYRGGRQQEVRKVEIPATDFDFQSANAKFNKEDLVKEAIASGSPLTAPGESIANGIDPAVVPGRKDSDHSIHTSTAPTYNKSTSFFDNLSSEIKDREESHGHRLGGREWRGEEQKKNLETFGQGSVDGYRGGYRGRGRGRYGRGRGYGGYRGRGPRGNRGGPQTPSAGMTVVNAHT